MEEVCLEESGMLLVCGKDSNIVSDGPGSLWDRVRR